MSGRKLPKFGSKQWRKEVCNFDPFAGDRYGSFRQIVLKVVRTRKRYRGCGFCFGMIAKGTLSRIDSAVVDGEFHTVRFCQECCDAMVLDGYDDGNTNVTAVEIREQLGFERRNKQELADK